MGDDFVKPKKKGPNDADRMRKLADDWWSHRIPLTNEEVIIEAGRIEKRWMKIIRRYARKGQRNVVLFMRVSSGGSVNTSPRVRYLNPGQIFTEEEFSDLEGEMVRRMRKRGFKMNPEGPWAHVGMGGLRKLSVANKDALAPGLGICDTEDDILRETVRQSDIVRRWRVEW